LEDNDDEQDQHENGNHADGNVGCLGKNLTDAQTQKNYEALLTRSNNGKLKKNTTRIVAHQFNVSIAIVQRIWKRVKQCREHGEVVDIR